MSDITARMAMAENEITISGDEYRELVIKAWKYDTLRKSAEKCPYNSELEIMIFELTEEEQSNVDKARNTPTAGATDGTENG